MTEENNALKASNVCPIMADVFNSMMVAGIDFQAVDVAMAVASLGDILLRECGVDPYAHDAIDAKATFADSFTDAIERKYGGDE